MSEVETSTGWAIKAIQADAAEAMRAKCEAIARDYLAKVGDERGLYNAGAGDMARDISDAIAAIKEASK